MSEPNQALATREVEYLAFGTQEKIRLTVGMVRQYVAAPAYDRQTKAEIQISDREATQFLMLCKARQLNVWEGDAFAVPFWDSRSNSHKWALITAHNAFLKRGEMHPAFEGMESGVIVEVDGEYRELPGDFVPDTVDGEKVKLVGGWAKVYRKDRKVPTYRRTKLSTFQKDFGQWVANPAGMICKTAEADALRSSFPNTCGGMYLREEMSQIGPTVEVQSEPAPERRPDFGQQGQGLIAGGTPTPMAKRKAAEKAAQAAKTAQEPPKGDPATSTQPAAENPTPPAQEAAQGAVERPNEPENPPAETTGEPQGEPEDLSTPPEPEPEPPQGEQAPERPDFVPNPRDTVAVQNVKRLCWEAGLSTDQLMTWAKAKKIAKQEQKDVAELAEQKLVNIANQWNTILPIIRQTAQAAGK